MQNHLLAAYLQADGTIDVLITPVETGDHNLFFGPCNHVAMTGNFESLADILVYLRLASSKTWCRKNNWDRPILPGYQEFTFGKLKYKICILAPFGGRNE